MAADPERIRVGSPELTVALRRSQRARRLTLRVAAGTGEAQVTAPLHAGLGEIRTVLEGQVPWLRDRIGAIPPQVEVDFGATLPVRGVPSVIEGHTSKRIALHGNRLYLPKDRQPGPMLRGWLRETARADLTAACDRFADAIGRRPTR